MALKFLHQIVHSFEGAQRNFEQLEQLNPVGAPAGKQLGVDAGSGSVTFSAATTATTTINHGLGRAPVSVQVTIFTASTGSLTANSYGYTPTQATVQFVSPTAISATVSFTWVAVG